jgi:hypothetical protein
MHTSHVRTPVRFHRKGKIVAPIMHITYIHIKYVERYVWTHVSSDFVLKRINK